MNEKHCHFTVGNFHAYCTEMPWWNYYKTTSFFRSLSTENLICITGFSQATELLIFSARQELVNVHVRLRFVVMNFAKISWSSINTSSYLPIKLKAMEGARSQELVGGLWTRRLRNLVKNSPRIWFGYMGHKPQLPNLYEVVYCVWKNVFITGNQWQ